MTTKKIKSLYISWSIMLILLFTMGCDKDDMTDDNPDSSSAGFLWEATYNDNTAYFLGTAHLGRREFYPLSNKITEALDGSDRVYVELTGNDIELAAILLTSATSAARDEPDDGIDNLPSPYRDRLREIIGDDQFDGLVTRNFEIHFYTTNVEVAAATSTDPSITAELGIDNYITTEATKKNKPIFSIDKIEDQVNVVLFEDESSVTDQVASLEAAIDNFDRTEIQQNLNEAIEAYQNGNHTYFEKIAEQTKTEEETVVIDGQSKWDVGVVIRNDNWTTQIADLLKADGNKQYFIAAGALHWFGEDSVIKKLQAKLPGVTIKQVSL